MIANSINVTLTWSTLAYAFPAIFLLCVGGKFRQPIWAARQPIAWSLSIAAFVGCLIFIRADQNEQQFNKAATEISRMSPAWAPLYSALLASDDLEERTKMIKVFCEKHASNTGNALLSPAGEESILATIASKAAKHGRTMWGSEKRRSRVKPCLKVFVVEYLSTEHLEELP